MQRGKWRALAIMTSAVLGIAGTILVTEKRAELQENNNLRLPCYWPGKESNNKHLVNCVRFLQDSWLDRSAKIYAENGPGVPAVVEGVVSTMIQYAGYPGAVTASGLYNGSEPDQLCAQQSKGSGPGLGPVCDLGFQNSSNENKPEFTTNWKGGSCGPSATLTVENGGVKVDLQGDRREFAYLNGARIQALKCHAAEVLGNLITPGQTEIVLTNPVARQMAQDFNTQILDRYKQLYLQLGFKTDDAVPLTCNWNNQDIQNEMTSIDGKTAPTLRDNKNNAIHICALRAMMTAAFTRIITYEIFSRMQTSYTTALLGSANQTAWADRISKNIGDVCKQECNATPTTACAQGCYDRKIGPEMQKEFDRLWPLPKMNINHCVQWSSMKAGAPANPNEPGCWPTQLEAGAKCQ